MLTKEQKDKISEKYIGKTYNYLTIIERDDNYKKEHNIKSNASYYKCQCKCGNFKTVRITTIVSGEVKSCGCLKKEQDKKNLIYSKEKFTDLTGKRFGKLVVLHKSDKKDKEIFWTCQCDCGNIKDIRGISLRNGVTASCGCLSMSHGEYKIKEILTNEQIPFIFNKIYFKDLFIPSGGIGRYDFIIFDNNHNPIRIIEYDGKQHFKAVDYFGGEERFIMRQQVDKAKNKYALLHNIPLVRIPYNELDNISLDLIMGDKYLIKDE